MHDDESAEETVMLTRRARRARTADGTGISDAGPPEADAVDEKTVVVDRGSFESGSVDEKTVVVERPANVERTVVVDRSRPAAASTAHDGAASDLDPSVADTIAAPPRRGADESAPAIYKPRPAPLVPSRPPVTAGGVAPTRDTASVTTSVLRRSRRTGIFALLSVGAACLVSVAGLATLGIVLLG
ncbi:hypothetical protein FVO59_07405 [Microbacterium esteraromaticum]|uniref:Uncharacterized protein n=1 Tax=Microbacterium esteraromaticum TaxID=57043 RepID=A0A7D8AJL4_9MICO|nr:hypothetical protein [Microbacterium esteraromaticum]QMU97069.1 hypothetical protein FVO59_07405 [Microbacterium esteraromaticum]